MELEKAKKVMTKDLEGNENGFLIELTKNGDLTTSYLSCCYPGAFKGYHLHKVREANYICIRGELAVIMYFETGREVVWLDASKPERLHIPINVPTGLLNLGDEEAWIINNPNPAYDPSLKDEQIDFTQAEMDAKYGKYPMFVRTKIGEGIVNTRGIARARLASQVNLATLDDPNHGFDIDEWDMTYLPAK